MLSPADPLEPQCSTAQWLMRPSYMATACPNDGASQKGKPRPTKSTVCLLRSHGRTSHLLGAILVPDSYQVGTESKPGYDCRPYSAFYGACFARHPTASQSTATSLHAALLFRVFAGRLEGLQSQFLPLPTTLRQSVDAYSPHMYKRHPNHNNNKQSEGLRLQQQVPQLAVQRLESARANLVPPSRCWERCRSQASAPRAWLQQDCAVSPTP